MPLSAGPAVKNRVLSALPQTEAIQVLTRSLDQMRHFLWFYVQVMTTDSDAPERANPATQKPLPKDASFIEKFSHISDAALLRYFAEGKNRKPN